MAKVKIYISPKQGILDPQGLAAQNVLEHLGFEAVDNVRIGKYITLEVRNGTTKEQIDKMCQKLLANPLIEDYSFEMI